MQQGNRKPNTEKTILQTSVRINKRTATVGNHMWGPESHSWTPILKSPTVSGHKRDMEEVQKLQCQWV